MGSLVVAMRPKASPGDLERRINKLALEQHAVARSDLLGLGLSPEAITRRLAGGRLIRLHQGVYSVGGAPPTRECRWSAAVLACGGGPGAALSHLSAAALWKLRPVDPVVIDVTVRRRNKRTRPGIRLHRPRVVEDREFTHRDGIPVTSVDRTLLDCASVLAQRPLERMLDEAEYLGLLDRSNLVKGLRRSRRRRGRARLLAVLARHEPGSTRTKNTLEESFLLLVRKSGFPEPQVNSRLGPYEIDFLWKAQRVAVETDGRSAHERASARERDYSRDAWLHARGFRPLRFTWAQVRGRADEVVSALAAALGET